MRVLVTDSDNRSALAAVRTLGKAGYTVLTAGDRFPSLAAVSRYSSGFERYPSAAEDPAGFLIAIAACVDKHAIDVVLPMTEITTLLLTQSRDSLPSRCIVPFASSSVIARAADKADVLRLANQLGVPIPRTLELASAAALDEVLEKVEYPTVVKPARSRVRTSAGFISTGVSYATNERELRERLQALHPEAFPVLLQERIVGPGVGVFACCDNGRPIAKFSHRRLREKPPSGGVSVLCESAPLDPLANEYADRLLSALGWHGVAMVEFKRNLSDGTLRLMEINGRFWGSLQLAIDAGVDFPGLMVKLAAGERIAPLTSYRIGVRNRWFWGDLDSLLLVLLKPRRSLNLPPGHPSRLRLLWQFLQWGGKDQHNEILRFDDPRPWLLESRRWLRGG